jgi:uncharacterized glyoxalase superfamily protein PhnB
MTDEPTFVAGVIYRDPKAAVAWLERAFGFETTMAIEGPPDAPEMCHYEMSHRGRGRLMVGVSTCVVHVQLPADVDGHCARARAAGAIIVAEPSDQFYGDRTYRAQDPEGHLWTFSEHVRDVSRAEAESALGQPILATNWE